MSEQNRAVEVYCQPSRGYGSGHRLTNGLILTAFHTLGGGSASHGSADCKVRAVGETSWRRAKLAWFDKELDVAVLSISPARSENITPVRWGLVPPDRRVACEARGFPRAFDHGAASTDYAFRGMIDPQTGAKRGLLAVKVAASEALPRAAKGWSGYSGAAVVCDGNAVAGVIVHTPEQAEGLVWARPAVDFIKNKAFRRLFAEDAAREPIVVRVSGTITRSDHSYERVYRQALLNEVSKLHLFGVDLDPHTPTQLPLEIAYIPLNLELADKSSTLDPLHLDYSELLAGLPLFGQRLLIEGVAGSGKTTLLQWTVLNALKGQSTGHLAVPTLADIQKKIEAWKTKLPSNAPLPSWVKDLVDAIDDFSEPVPQAGALSWWERIPFLVRLRQCPSGLLPAPDKLPTLIAREAGRPDENWVTGTLRSGAALILLDGVDEVPDQNREEIRQSIKRYMELYADCQFVITSRPAAVRQSRWADLFVPWRVAIRPMAPVDIRNFVEHWYQALRHERRTEGLDPAHEENARQIQDQIANSSALSQLAETPLLCSAICYLHRIRKGELPRRLNSLYGKLCELLVHRLDRERLKAEALTQFSPPFYQLELEDKLQILARLAHFMVREQLSSLDVVRAAEQVKGELLRLRKPEQLTPREVLFALQERSGVLRGATETDVEFAHNALRSYLAAIIFAREGSVKELIYNAEALDDPDLAVLAGAQGSDWYRAQLIDALAGWSAAPNSDVSRANLITAVRVAATGPVPDGVVAQVNALESRLLPAQTQEEARHFGELGDRIIDRLIYDAAMPVDSAAACVRTLRFIGGPRGRDALEQYRSAFGAAKPASAALEELAQAMNPLRLPTVLKLLTSALPYGAHPNARKQLVHHVGDRDLETFENPNSIRSLNLEFTSVKDLSVLERYENLHSLNVVTNLKSASALPQLSSLRVLFLRLDGSSPERPQSPRELEILPPHLTNLVLDSSAAGNYGFLSQAPQLRELSLYDTDAYDLADCEDCRNLECLYIDETAIDDLDPLAGLSSLRMLVADDSQVSDLSALRDMKNIEILSLQGTKVTECEALSRLVQLRMLVLRRTEITNLESLGTCGNLEILDVCETGISDLGPLRHLLKLKRLLLADTKVSDLRPVGRLQCLEELCLDRTQVDDLTSLLQLPALKELWIRELRLKDARTIDVLRKRGVAVRGEKARA